MHVNDVKRLAKTTVSCVLKGLHFAIRVTSALTAHGSDGGASRLLQEPIRLRSGSIA